MDDIDKILAAAEGLSRENKRFVIATLVDVEGTAFRHIGARMLIDCDGIVAGAITAGCIEADLAEKAQKVLNDGAVAISRYDTGSEKEILFGWGSGCDGILMVLLERGDIGEGARLIDVLKAARSARRAADLLTIFDVAGESDRLSLGKHLTGAEESALFDDSDGRRSRIVSFQDGSAQIKALAERVEPPPRLVIFGGGAVAEPLAGFGVETGWEVHVVDRRPAVIAAAQLPKGVSSLCAPYEMVTEKIVLDSATAVVILTHNFLDDALLVALALDSPVRSISVMSSQARAGKLIDHVEETRGPLTESERARIYAPAGLDIGGGSAARIALSIQAQLQQVFAGATGRTLRNGRPQ